MSGYVMFHAPTLVGICNVTPDSFSDGGAAYDPDAAIAQVRALWNDGAAVVDIGAESTRPGAVPLAPGEEWTRLAPVLETVTAWEERPVVSVDTRHPATAHSALALGVDWLNDVSGFADPAMVEIAAAFPQTRLVVMHSLSIPADPAQTLSEDADPAAEVREWAEARLSALEVAGIARERCILDPGIGFGKTAAQSLRLLRDTGRLDGLGAPLLIGHSRKSFLAAFADAPPADRDPETLAASLCLARHPHVRYLRVHNPALHARAFRLAEALASHAIP